MERIHTNLPFEMKRERETETEVHSSTAMNQSRDGQGTGQRFLRGGQEKNLPWVRAGAGQRWNLSLPSLPAV